MIATAAKIATKKEAEAYFSSSRPGVSSLAENLKLRTNQVRLTEKERGESESERESKSERECERKTERATDTETETARHRPRTVSNMAKTSSQEEQEAGRIQEQGQEIEIETAIDTD